MKKRYLLLTIFILFLFFSVSGARAAVDVGDGDLIRLSGDYKVYVVKLVSGKRYIRWLVAQDVVRFYGHLDLLKTKVVGLEEFNRYEESSLIRGGGDYKVYSVGNVRAGRGAVKYWVRSSGDYPDFDFDAVYAINERESLFYGVGENYDTKKAGRVSKFQDASKSSNKFVSGSDSRFKTFIISWPDKIAETDKVIFEFSGEDLEQPDKNVKFETFLEGYDDKWQSSYGSSRTVYLDPGDKYYEFRVRSRSSDGSVDISPATYSFRAALSPYYKKIKISRGSIKARSYLDEYIKLTTNFSKDDMPVNITGWTLSRAKGEIKIPQAVKMLYLQYGSEKREDIYVAKGEVVRIFTPKSPFLLNFRLNKCSGYLNNTYNFNYTLPNNCPRPDWEAVPNVSANCRDYINSLRSCEEPNPNDLRIAYDNDCKGYLSSFHYSGCVMSEQGNDDFLSGYSYNEWRVYLGRNENVWDDRHDTIRLRDRSGLIVDEYIY